MDGHDHGTDWLGAIIAGTKYAGGRGAILSSWVMLPVGIVLGVFVAYVDWLGGSPVDPVTAGGAVAFLIVFAAPYVHHWTRNSIRRGRGNCAPRGGNADGPAATAERSADANRGG